MPTDTEQDFDLDAWIDGARLPERSVTVYGRADLVAEHQALEEERQRLERASIGDDRIAGPLYDVAAQVIEAEKRMQESALTIRFRALMRDEAKAITSAAPKDSSGEPEADYLAAAWLAASSVSPKMTPDQVNAIRAKIGEGQFNSLWQAAWGVSNDRRPDVPFSFAASANLKNRDS